MIEIISVIVLLMGIMFFLCGFKQIKYPAMYAVAVIPMQMECFLLPGFKINEIGIILWILCYIIKAIREKKIKIPKQLKIFLFVLGGIGCINICQYLVYSNLESLIEYFRFFIAIFFPISLISAFRNDLSVFINSVLNAWCVAATFCAVFSIINIFFNGYNLNSYISAFFSSDVQGFYQLKFLASPFYADPNNYAGYLLFSLGISFYLYRSLKFLKYLWASCILIVVLFLSLSRGAYIALILGVFVLLLLYKRTRLLTTLFCSLILVMSVPFLYGYLSKDISAMSRFDLWGIAFRMFLDHPFVGVGLGNFTHLFGEYVVSDVLIYNPYTHNLFLKILTEIGFIGELVFFGICYLNIKKNIILIRRGKLIGYLFLFCIITFLIQGFSVEFFSSNYFWFILVISTYFGEKIILK